MNDTPEGPYDFTPRQPNNQWAGQPQYQGMSPSSPHAGMGDPGQGGATGPVIQMADGTTRVPAGGGAGSYQGGSSRGMNYPNGPGGQAEWRAEQARFRRRTTLYTVIGVLVAVVLSVPTTMLAMAYMGSTVTTSKGMDDGKEAPAVTSSGDLADGDPLTVVQRVAAYAMPSVAQVLTEDGVGSAVAYKHNGYYITNNHVIKGAHDIRLTMPNGKGYPAKVVGTAEAYDLAVIKIDADINPLTFVKDLPPVGSTVVAIGAPHGFDFSVSSGIISALDRNLGRDASGMLQTDAAINPGNSGGPLLNIHGQVVGINTIQFRGQSGGNIGINMSIPATIATKIADQLIEKGYYEMAQLGIRGTNVNEIVARQLNLGVTEGVLLLEVGDATAAQRGGLHEGDVIASFDGKPVNSIVELNADIRQRAPGDTIVISWYKGGGKVLKTETFTLGGVKATQ